MSNHVCNELSYIIFFARFLNYITTLFFFRKFRTNHYFNALLYNF